MIRLHHTASTCIVLSFLIVQRGTSQEESRPHSAATDSTAYTLTLSPVTIHAPSVSSPFSVTGISKRNIELQYAPTIEPLLNSTAGIWMQSGALNTNRISIRGVGYREPFATTGIKIYLDEIPLTNGAGEASVEDIHPLILSGIDIWRGPASALWGSGLGGMIHLKSQLPDEDIWQTGIQAGSFGRWQLDQHLSIRYGRQRQWGSSVHYQYLEDDGYRENNSYKKHSLTWMQQWYNGKGIALNTLLHGIGLKAFIPSSIHQADFNDNPSRAAPAWASVKGHEDYTKWIAGLHATIAPRSGWVYKGSVFSHFFSSDEVRPFNVLEESNAAYGTRHRMTTEIKNRGHVTAGFEYLMERYAFRTFETLDGGTPGQELSDQMENRSYLNGFVQSEWYVGPRWYAFAGLSSVWSQLSISDSKADIPFDIFPTFGISYSTAKKLSLTASLSRGYSALSLSNLLNSDGSIDPDIKPETGWSREISLKKDNGVGGHARISLFMMNIKNTIITRRIMDDVFERINGGSTIHRGIEMEATSVSANQKLSTTIAWTIGDYQFDEFLDDGQDRSGNKLPGVPRDRLFMRVQYSPWPRLQIHLDMSNSAEVYLDDANSLQGQGYTLIHPGVRYTMVQKLKWQGTISATVHNALDAHYASLFQINAPDSEPRYFYPGKPRSLYLNFSMRHVLK